jgi:hypothetical protein
MNEARLLFLFKKLERARDKRALRKMEEEEAQEKARADAKADAKKALENRPFDTPMLRLNRDEMRRGMDDLPPGRSDTADNWRRDDKPPAPAPVQESNVYRPPGAIAAAAAAAGARGPTFAPSIRPAPTGGRDFSGLGGGGFSAGGSGQPGGGDGGGGGPAGRFSALGGGGGSAAPPGAGKPPMSGGRDFGSLRDPRF